MHDHPEAFESHAVAVMASLAECMQSWDALLALGIAAGDVGVVVSAAALVAGRALLGQGDGDGRARAFFADGRADGLEPVPGAPDGAGLLASRGYPGDLLRAANAEGTRPRASAFDGLMPVRDGLALSQALADGGAAIWARSRSPEAASRVAELLLRTSSHRVRTFTRAEPGAESTRKGPTCPT